MQKQVSLLILVCFMVCLHGTRVMGQDVVKKDTTKHKIIDDFPEGYPLFLGGSTETFIREHLKYPDSAYCYCYEGTALIEISISEEGKVTALRSLNQLPYGCTAEAMRVVGLMKDWQPAMIYDFPVSGKLLFCIKFRLYD